MSDNSKPSSSDDLRDEYDPSLIRAGDRGKYVERFSTGRSVMSPVKESAIRLIESLPDDCTVEDIHYHLYVREKVERGMKAVDAGQVVSQAEAERRVSEWGASIGASRP